VASANPYNPYTTSLVRAVRGPILLITIGTLAALDHFGPYPFSQTWPVIFIVYGILWLGERLTRHPDTQTPGRGTL
jgi:hypothetical protein